MANDPVAFNRILEVMAHTTRYAFKGASRLARDAGICRSALNRLINGTTSPSYFVVSAVASVLEERLGHSIDPRDLVSSNGYYLTPSLQELCGCRGCAVCRDYDARHGQKLTA